MKFTNLFSSVHFKKKNHFNFTSKNVKFNSKFTSELAIHSKSLLLVFCLQLPLNSSGEMMGDGCVDGTFKFKRLSNATEREKIGKKRTQVKAKVKF